MLNFEDDISTSTLGDIEPLRDVSYNELSEELLSGVFVDQANCLYLMRGSLGRVLGFLQNTTMFGCQKENPVFSDDDRLLGYEETPERTFVLKRIFSIKQNLQTICNLLDHARWLTNQLLEGNLPPGAWQAYFRTDIHTFHSEIRSIFDHLAEALDGGRNVLPDSFEKLKNGVEINGNSKYGTRLDANIIALIKECEWFTELRASRNAIEHQGFDAAIRFEPGQNKAFFKLERHQVGGYFKLPERFPKASEYVQFEIYAGYYMGRLLAFLNRLSVLLIRQHRMSRSYFWQPKRFQTCAGYIVLAASTFQITAQHSQK
jgi:hypothetical protein